MFTPEVIYDTKDRKLKVSQIVRNFILAEKYGKVHVLKRVYSVVIAPEDHPTTKNEIKSLQSQVNKETEGRVLALSLEDFNKLSGYIVQANT